MEEGLRSRKDMFGCVVAYLKRKDNDHDYREALRICGCFKFLKVERYSLFEMCYRMMYIGCYGKKKSMVLGTKVVLGSSCEIGNWICALVWLNEKKGAEWTCAALGHYISHSLCFVSDAILGKDVSSGVVPEFVQRDFRAMYENRLRSTLAVAQTTLLGLDGKKKSDEHSSSYFQYTYQVVFSVNVDDPNIQYRFRARAPGKRGDAMVKDGRMLKRLFVCFSSVDSCICFFLNWFRVQQSSHGCGRFCDVMTLLECGVLNDESHYRKWIIDVDASLNDLYARRLIETCDIVSPEESVELHRMVLLIGSAVSRSLCKAGFLYYPCLFTVLTRHTKKKMSWHITMNALAPHSTWRHVMFALDKEFSSYASDWLVMYSFVDKTTRNNSRSQYMQTMSSSKITEAIGDRDSYLLFEFCGIFNADAKLVTKFDMILDADLACVMKYVSSSMMIRDPWSVMFVRCDLDSFIGTGRQAGIRNKRRVVTTTSSVDAHPKRNAIFKRGICIGTSDNAKGEGGQSTSSGCSDECFSSLASWDKLPDKERVWMQRFIETESSSLSFLPSMAKKSNMCEEVRRLLSMGRCEVLVHAYVYDAALCPRYWKVAKKVHKHGSNSKCVVVCIREWNPRMSGVPSDYRMFVYCMSGKCKNVVNAVYKQGWLEIDANDYSDLLLAQRR